MLMFFLFVVID